MPIPVPLLGIGHRRAGYGKRLAFLKIPQRRVPGLAPRSGAVYRNTHARVIPNGCRRIATGTLEPGRAAAGVTHNTVTILVRVRPSRDSIQEQVIVLIRPSGSEVHLVERPFIGQIPQIHAVLWRKRGIVFNRIVEQPRKGSHADPTQTFGRRRTPSRHPCPQRLFGPSNGPFRHRAFIDGFTKLEVFVVARYRRGHAAVLFGAAFQVTVCEKRPIHALQVGAA